MNELKSKRFLVTGAAGFIGSNLVEHLVGAGATVFAVDNFITGKRENLAPFLNRIEFVEGDVRDLALCRRLAKGVDFILHQAALGSVPRSVDDPATTHDHNVNGTFNVLLAAREARVQRVVYASSSSAYGNTEELPKVETMALRPLSPYAVSKLVGEHYCSAFHKVYDLPAIALRYFNVFGPRQDPAGAYAAMIPRTIGSILEGRRPVIFGDGEQSRDFTYVGNVVQANLLACQAPADAFGSVFNIGAGGRTTINELTRNLLRLLGSKLEPAYEPARRGDVRHSQADISRARAVLGYAPTVAVSDGLAKTVACFAPASNR